MPEIKRSLVKECGLQEFVQKAIDAGFRQPKDIADELNRQDIVTAKTNGKKVLSSDIAKYLTQIHSEDVGSYDRALQNSPTAQGIVNAASRAMSDVVRRAEAASALSDMLYSDINELHRMWAIEREAAGDLESVPEPKHLTHLNTWLRNLKLMLEVANTIKGDERIQQVIKAQAVNVSQGMSQDEFFDALFGVCQMLGIERGDAMSAFAEYQQSKGKTLDAEWAEK